MTVICGCLMLIYYAITKIWYDLFIGLGFVYCSKIVSKV